MHILLSLRTVTPGGWGQKCRAWNARALHEQWREAWETAVNVRLAERGIDARIDRRSYQDRGLGLAASVHEGASYSQRRRQAASMPETVRTSENEARRQRNAEAIAANPALVADELTHYAATFTRADVDRAIVRHTGSPARPLVDAVMRSSAVRRLGVDLDGQERFSTEAVIETERRLLASADRLAEQSQVVATRIDSTAIRDEMRRAGRSDEQVEAVVHLTRPTRIAIVSGVAGAGKTTMLRSAVAAWQGAGLTVQGVALAAQAAAVLREDTGLPSGTVTRLLARLDAGDERLGPHHVVVLDEAGMLHSSDMARLLEHVERSGAKIVLTGDAEQIQAVQAGAPFRALEARLGAVRLTDARRQRDQGDRTATVAMGAGRTRLGLQHYRDTGRISASPTRDAMLSDIVGSYLSDARAIGHDQTLLLAHRRRDVRELNNLVRQALQQAGEITGGREYTVTDRSASGQARSVRREFGTGDRVLFRQNSRVLGVENGTVGTVIATHAGSLDVRVGETVKRVNLAEYSHIDHAYARTLHKGQGATAERVHGVLSGSMDRNLSYVLLSRHRESVRAYWNAADEISWERLSARLVRAGGKDMASDYAEARRIAADQFERESQQERDAARQTRLGAVLHSLRSVLGLDRARQEREAAAQRARAEAVEQALAEQRVAEVRREQQRYREQVREALPAYYRPLADVFQGHHQENWALSSLRNLKHVPERATQVLQALLYERERIANDQEREALFRLASAAIDYVPRGDQHNLQTTADLLETLTTRLEAYDAESAGYRQWSDRQRQGYERPDYLHMQLYQTVEKNPGNISLYNLRDAPRARYAEIYRRREARDSNQSRGYSPER